MDLGARAASVQFLIRHRAGQFTDSFDAVFTAEGMDEVFGTHRACAPGGCCVVAAGVLNRTGFGGLGAAEDRRALLGKGPEALEVVAAVVSLPSQPLDALVHMRRNGLVVRQDAELLLDDRHGHG